MGFQSHQVFYLNFCRFFFLLIFSCLAVYVFLVAIFKPLLSHSAVVGLACGGIALIFSVVLLPIGTGPWVVRRQPDAPVVVR
jgi:hypothetical protein